MPMAAVAQYPCQGSLDFTQGKTKESIQNLSPDEITEHVTLIIVTLGYRKLRVGGLPRVFPEVTIQMNMQGRHSPWKLPTML